MIDEKKFDQIWKIYQEIGRFELHFNDLESRYRTIASTWILGAFAAMGFAWSADLGVPEDKYLIVAVIGLCVCLGLGLLVMLDLSVYHCLLDAAFIEGKELEEKYDWLPQIRTNMADSQGDKGVIWKAKLFYKMSTGIMAVISIAAMFVWVNNSNFNEYHITCIILIYMIVIGLTIYMFSTIKGFDKVDKN